MIRFIGDIHSSEKKKLKDKTAILRVDLNISSRDIGKNPRFLSIFKTINFLLKNKARILILSHRGRPKPAERANSKFQIPNSNKFSLKPFVSILSKKLRKKISFINHFNFLDIKQKIKNSPNGSIFLLENLRFLPGEEKNNRELAKKLATLGDFYVNDAFGVCHRFNSSVVSLPKFLPAYAGFLLKKEIKNLDLVIQKINHPFVIILGGAKISDKLGVIQHFWRQADYFLFGGGPANTLIAAKNLPVGGSLVEKNALNVVKSVAFSNGVNKFLNSPKIILPMDVKIKNNQILDVGVKTIKRYQEIIQKAKTVIWSGPMGLYEKKEFEKGTKGIWQAILNNKKANIVVGGGDTLASLLSRTHADLTRTYTENSSPYKSASSPYKSVSGQYQSVFGQYKSVFSQRKSALFLSTGGGAMLKYLADEKLPGIEALK